MAQEFTLKHAKAVAAVLKRHSLIQEVVLFGSVAQKGRGRDIDLALAIPPLKALMFNFLIPQEMIKRGIRGGNPATRDKIAISKVFEDVAVKILGEDFEKLLAEAKSLLPAQEAVLIDLFPVPYNWRDIVSQMRSLSPVDDRLWGDIERGTVL